MGVDVYLEDEHGKPIKELPDRKSILSGMIQESLDKLLLLRYVDIYGDTAFNKLQANDLLRDIETLKSSYVTQEEIDFLERLQEMVMELAQEIHVYLKFYGD
jgi:hypothetical protein